MVTVSANDAIEMIKRIVADDTADLRERVQHLEAKVGAEVEATEMVDNQPTREDGGDPPPQAKQMVELVKRVKDYEARIEKIKAIHRLDATPVQWTTGPQGKMVEAPEGLWEIQCVICRDVPPIVWRSGESKPPLCLTARLADGQE